MSVENTEKSAFNFGFEYLKQISEALRMCDAASRMQDINGWYLGLRNVFRQISIKTNETEDKDVENAFKEVVQIMNDPNKRIDERGKCLYQLDKLDMKLRKLMDQKGMGLPNAEDPRFAIMKR